MPSASACQLASRMLAETPTVLRIRPRPSPFDHVDPESIQSMGNAQLVVDREGDVLALRAVAQRRVEKLDDGGVHEYASVLVWCVCPLSVVRGQLLMLLRKAPINNAN